MTDITHNNVFTTDATTNLNYAPRRRILDEGPSLPERATDHETPPYVPPPEKSISERVADKSIGIVDEAATHVMTKLQELKDKIGAAEQMVLNSQVEVRETIRAHMRIVEAAAKIGQHVDRELKEAMEPLAALTNGK